MKFTKKLLSLLLAIAMLFSITASIDLSAFAVTKPSVTVKAVSNLTTNSVQLNFTANNPSKVTIKTIGVQVRKKGTSSWTSKKEAMNSSYTNSNSVPMWWTVGSGKELNMSLSAGTTYEYRAYVVYSGTNYYSSTSTFTTKSATSTTTTSSKKYKKISALKVPRIYQQAYSTFGGGDCNFDSVASVQAYVLSLQNKSYTYGKTTRSYSHGKDYKATNSKNNAFEDPICKKMYDLSKGTVDPTSILSKLPVVSMSMETCNGNTTATYEKIYNQLKKGKPVVIHAKGATHASVVIGYTKDSSSLSASNFSVMEITQGGQCWKNSTDNFNKYANNPQTGQYSSSCYRTLQSWLTDNGNRTINQIYYPTSMPSTTNTCTHTWNSGSVTKAATCKATGTKTYTCTKCKATKTETIAKSTKHSYKTTTTKATTSKNGSIVTKCTVCGNVSKNTTIAYPKTITLSASSYTYDGKVKTPSVTVKDSNGKNIASSNYTVSNPSGRKNVGTYTVTITFKGNYSGTVKKSFTIKPKSTTVSSVTANSKAFTIKWKKQATQTTGYQIQYSTSSNFSNAKTVTVSKNGTTSKKITGLTGKKKYYVRVRTYKTVGKTKIYSSWSASKTVTTKK